MLRLFALFSYAAFHISLIYFFGFLSGFIGGHPPTTSSAIAVAIDLALLAFFAITHSVLARPGFKRACSRIVGLQAELSIYLLVASAQVALICWQWRPLPGPTLWSASGWACTCCSRPQD